MGFYIEELPTELNGITMQEADYLADELLSETPCNRMWDAMRALRDFYETVTSEAVEVVRCGDCRYAEVEGRTTHYLVCQRHPYSVRTVDLSDYCSEGKRKEGE